MMKNMKKALIYFIVSAMMLSMAGCSYPVTPPSAYGGEKETARRKYNELKQKLDGEAAAMFKPSSGDDNPVVKESTLGNSYSVTVTDEPEAVPFTLVEIKPKFQEGDANKFARWVNEQLQYPEEAREKKLQGRVTLQFVVEKDGSVTGVRVLRGIDPILDEETMRVVSLSPKWTPGYINGKPVRIVYNCPVVFQLK